MELKPLAEMLEDMLYEADDAGFDVCLADAPTVQPEEWAAVCAEYRARYGRAVLSVSALRGEPTFSGDPRREPSLAWIAATEASVWLDPAGSLYVARVETPVGAQVVAGGRPLRREPNAITVLPPGD